MAVFSQQQVRLPESVAKILSKYDVVDLRANNARVYEIKHESINQSYKIVTDDCELLLKLISSGKDLPINRKRVFRLQEELAIVGLAPRPIFLNAEQNIYCEQWVNFDPICDDQQVSAMAQALYSVHSAFVSAPKLSLDEHWESYWSSIDFPSPSLVKEYKHALVQWYEYVSIHQDDFVLCHNDLHAHHLCHKNGPLLDWEYAGLGCRYFDIASCSVINELSSEQHHRLCSDYAHCAGHDTENVVRMVEDTARLVSFTYKLWSMSLGVEKAEQ